MVQKIVLGAIDAITAQICQQLGADYIWVSSFVLSSIAGEKDSDASDLRYYIPTLRSLRRGAKLPIIFDFGARGENMQDFKRQLRLLKDCVIAGICIEDEKFPKINAMISDASRRLIAPDLMVQKIKITRSILGGKVQIIARTHSLIIQESYVTLQERIKKYISAGADIICIHYTGKKWKSYAKLINDISITYPLMLILSSTDSIPMSLFRNKKIGYIVFPNQIYRMMLFPIFKFKKEYQIKGKQISFSTEHLEDREQIFQIIKKITSSKKYEANSR